MLENTLGKTQAVISHMDSLRILESISIQVVNSSRTSSKVIMVPQTIIAEVKDELLAAIERRIVDILEDISETIDIVETDEQEG